MSWAFGDDEPQIWHWGVADAPYDVIKHVAKGGKVVAHNAPFELAIWNNILVPRYGWPELKPEQTYCTMAMAYAMGLPGALEDAALALGLSVLKDTEGRSLMLRMSRPRSYKPDGTPIWWDDEDKLKRLYAYCQQDVRVERELEKRLMPLSEKERKVWLLDYRINQRGVAVDVETAKAAVAMTEEVKLRCNQELSRLTENAVQTVTAVAALKTWMEGKGVKAESLAKQALTDLLDTDLPDDVRRALILRQEAGKASTAKLDRMLNMVGSDNRLRNMYQYHGAATGRWAGRGVQVHNLPRDLPEPEVVEHIFKLVRAGDYDAIDMIYGPPMTMISRCLRSFFIPERDKLIVSGDWSNVESRGAAWFAGEQWKLEAFRRQDDGTGPEVYVLGASRLLGCSIDQVTKEQRQAYGKVPDLAFQYQGGIGSGKIMGKTYGVKATDDEWERRKQAWRAAHPAITKIWPALQRAAIDAVRNPGEKFGVGVVGRQAFFKVAGSFLWCLLPSGRAICFPYPKVLEGEYGPQLTYMTVPDPNKPEKIVADPKNASNWARVSTYGGALLNRVVQGFCRDFLADGMLPLHEQGAPLILHTHDSLALEIEAEKASRVRDYLEQSMRTAPAWAQGFPLIAKPEIVARYNG